mmetsp:Transcript_43480/g.69980  ORF Transcript_43480/g.69980 Transcript_43480/m.69980 type:complete len:190 (+) Transcript_43480:612-1181(+)
MAALLESRRANSSKSRESLKMFADGSNAQHAVACISSLSFSKEVCVALSGSDAPSSLVNCILCGMHGPAAEFAVTALINLSTQRPETRGKLEHCGAIEAITDMLAESQAAAKIEKCLALLSILSLSARSRDRVRQAGAIPHIVEKLSAARPDANVTKAALSCLLTLCHSNVKNKLEVSKVNTIVTQIVL